VVLQAQVVREMRVVVEYDIQVVLMVLVVVVVVLVHLVVMRQVQVLVMEVMEQHQALLELAHITLVVEEVVVAHRILAVV